jgi:hypothetical protein
MQVVFGPLVPNIIKIHFYQLKKMYINSHEIENCVLVPHFILFFLIRIVGGGWSPNWVHSARRLLTGLLYLSRVIVRMEHLVQ